MILNEIYLCYFIQENALQIGADFVLASMCCFSPFQELSFSILSMAEGDDPDLSLLDLNRAHFAGTGSHGDDHGYHVFRTNARDPSPAKEECYHALSLAYQDLKKRYNSLQVLWVDSLKLCYNDTHQGSMIPGLR